MLSLAGWPFCIYSIFYPTLLAIGCFRDQLRVGAYLATATAIGVAGGAMFGAASVRFGVGLATVSAAPWYFRLARIKWGSAYSRGLGGAGRRRDFYARGADDIKARRAQPSSPACELSLLITLGGVAYCGFVALFGQRAIFSDLALVRRPRRSASRRPSMARTSDSCVDQITERQRRGLRKCNTWSGSARTCRVAVGVAIDSR